MEKGKDGTEQYLHWGGRTKERQRKEESRKVGGQNRTVTNHPPWKEESRKERGKRKEGKAGAEQNSDQSPLG